MSHTCKDSFKVYTVGDWLSGCVNFEVPDEAVNTVCMSRCIDPASSYVSDGDYDIDIRLLKADLLKWIVMGPSRVTDTKDQDNGWMHAGGGYTLSEYDKKLLMGEANAIYEELEPESVFGKKKIRMRSAGIMPAYRDIDGEPLPRRPL